MSGLSIIQYFPYMRVKITEQPVHGEAGNSALIQRVPDLRYRPLCHACGSPTGTVHSQTASPEDLIKKKNGLNN
jgi:hypothetical protein